MSTLVYGIPVFGGINKNLMSSLQVLQNKTARILTKLPRMGTHISELLSEAKFLSVHQLSFFGKLLENHQIKKNEYLYDRIINAERNENLNHVSLGRKVKQQHRERQNPCNLVIMENSFVCRTKSYWVQIPEKIRKESKSIKSIKNEVKKWVLKNVPIVP